MEELSEKLNRYFPGKVVRKDLTKKIKEGANVPVYVLEYLLGMYCATDDEKAIEDGVEQVKNILADNFVRPDEAEKVKSKIKENAYIDTVKISRKIPDSIEISVTERQASYAVEYANAYAYISSQGYILEISSQKPNMPILTGIKTQSEDIQPGNRLNNDNLNRLGDVLKIMEAASSNGISDLITKINVTNTYDYVLTLQSKKKTVYLGDTTNLSTKMLWIVTFNEKEGNTAGDIILNMNLNEEKNKPVFRKKL